MKIKLLPRVLWILLALIATVSIKAQSPTYLLELRNDLQVSATVFEFDVYLLRTGVNPFEYAGAQFGIIINSSVKNGGVITPTIVTGSSDPAIVATAQNPTSITFLDASNAIRIAARVPPGTGNGAIISNVTPGTRICRVRLTNNVAFGCFQPDLAFTTTTIYPTQVSAYVGGLNTGITTHAWHTTTNLANLIMSPPANPTLSGPTPVTVHSINNVYTTESGNTNYIWTVSAGGTITAGGTATSNTATITWNTAGAQSVSVNYSGLGGPAPTPTVYPVTVNPATLTVTGINANKVYDATTIAPINIGGAILNGVIGGDVVTLSSSGVSGTFTNKNVGSGKPVTITGMFSLGGANAGNYTLTQPTVTGTISPFNLTILNVTANSKVYDRLVTATLNTGTAALSGVITGDVVTLNPAGATGTFANKNVGTGKVVTITGFSIGGTDVGNYTLTQPTATASITAATLTITGVTANNKVYDGTTAATLNTGTAALAGIIAPDVVTLNVAGATGTFSDPNVGTGKTVTTSGFSTGGTDAGNYTVTQPVTTADITAAPLIPLTISGVTVNNKVYNGTTAATLNTGTAALVGVVAPDVVTLNVAGATGTFANKNVGTGKVVTITGFTLGGADAAKYTLTQPTGTANITAATLTITGVTANNKVYNATTAATLNTGTAVLAGIIASDVVTLNISGATGTFANKNVGTGKVVTITGFAIGGTDAGNYTVTQPTCTANITAATLTITGVTANNKVYDGTTAATLNTGPAALSGVIAGDVITLSTVGATGTFSDPNVGTGKTVTTSGFSINGTDAGNYTLTQPVTTADITAAPLIPLTISGVTANNKVYNGTTAATLNTGTAALVGVVAPDVVTLNVAGATGTFANKNVGTGKTVTMTGFTLGGADAAKYTLTQPTGTANITTATLTITGVTANNKVYNGTTAATLNTGTAALVGVVAPDVVTLNVAGATGTFANKNVGTGKVVTITGFAIGGTDAGNYTVTQPTATTNITTATLTITGVTANNKVYDGTTAAILNTGTAALAGIIAPDVVTLNVAGATGTFANKNVGTGKVVTITGFAIGGTDAGNYTVTQPTCTANITAATLTITGVTANNKVYDGTTAATLNTGTAALAGIIAPDVVTLNVVGATGTFADPNVGTGKTVTTSGFSTGGTDAGNYTVTQPVTTADITAAPLIPLTISGVTVNNKVYNGTTAATLNTGTAALVGVVAPDVVTLNVAGATGTFANKNVGTGKVVTITGFTLGGADAAKYTLTQPTGTANITAATLTITGVTANNKVYNATTAATLNTGTAVLAGIIASDVVTLNISGATGTFANKNVGTGKVVTITGFTLGGTDAGNYTVTQPTCTANITAATLTITGVTANNKVYDGTTAATLNTGTAALAGIIAPDVITLNVAGATGTFADPNVGTGKTVTTSGFSIGGTDAGNYTVTQPVTTADITAAPLIPLTISGVTVNNKVYNGTTAATLNTGTAALVGVVAPDVVTLNVAGATGTFANKNVGTGKVVTITGFTLGGADAAKYTLTQPTGTANITAATLTITGVTANNKVYNATTAATLNTGTAVLAGIIASDVVTLNISGATGTFANKNVGTGKVVTITGFSIGGTDAGNYTVTQPTATANITAATLTITGVTANNKVYDGTTAATLNTGTAALAGIIAPDVVTLNVAGATGTFSDPNVGTGKTVTTSGFSTGGTDAGNYTVTQPVTTADITAAPLIPLTISGVTVNNKVYNGTTAATLNTGTAALVGVVAPDVVTLNVAGATGTFANKNVGTGKVVTITGFTLGGADAAKYTLTQPTGTANITAATLTITGVTANNKVYNATTAATLNTGTAVLAGIIASDVVTLNISGATGTFANKNVGTGKVVTITGFTLGGTDAGNYTVTQPTCTANITAATLTITGVTANNKVYDGTTAATLNTGTAALAGIIAPDVITLNVAGATGTFADPNVGTGKTVTTSGFSIGGTDAGNYTVTQPVTTADITAAPLIPLTISGVTVNNKVYNGTTAATLNTGTAALVGVVAPDVVTLNVAGATGTFANKNVGTGKVVTITGFTLGGADAAKYTLTQPTGTANITTATLTITGVTANNKVYNGTTAATLNTGTAVLAGIIAPDVVTLNVAGATGTFANKNVGTGKVVTITGFSIGGTDAGNYTLTQPTATANITTATLTITGVTANNKVYDGTTAATLNTGTAALAGIIAPDVVTLNVAGATGTFADPNVGTGKTVTTSGFSIGGTDAGNYTVTQPATTADITDSSLIPLAITGVTAINKVYDGVTTATLNTGTAALSGVIAGDYVTLNTAGATGTFTNKNVGTGKTVTITGFTLGGADAGKYTLTQPSVAADILPKPLTISAINQEKLYGSTVIFTGFEYTVTGLVSGDIISGLTINSPGEIATASTGSYVIYISGATDPNYDITWLEATLTVNKYLLTANADNLVKPYGAMNPVLSVTYSGFRNGEDVTVLDEAPVASTSAVTASITGIYPVTLSGGSDNNYDLSLADGTLTIVKAPLIITAGNQTRQHGEPNPVLTIAYSGFVLGEGQSALDVLPMVVTNADETSDAGTYPILVSGAGDTNYSFVYVNGTLTINKSNQVITFNEPPAGLRMTQEIELAATTTSGLPVTFTSSDPDIASISGNILMVNKEGTVIITASQDGNVNWNPAVSVPVSLITLPTFDNIMSLFTPNNDGMNDLWYFPDLVSFGRLEVTVYNRFGQTVYRSDSYKNNWDGTWNGTPLPSASYYYIIKSSEKGIIRGIVNIVR